MWSQNALDPAYNRCKQDNLKSCGNNKNKIDAYGFP